MPNFGDASKAKLRLLDSRLAAVLEEAIKITDFTVIETQRSKEKQDKMVAEGKSKLAWPKSKHNATPALAADIAPWPIDWNDTDRFSHLAGVVRGIAQQMCVPLRWGGDWDRDGELSNNRFNDLPHVEVDE